MKMPPVREYASALVFQIYEALNCFLKLIVYFFVYTGTVQLGKALLENNFMPTSLLKLDLSGNQFKDGDINVSLIQIIISNK